MDATGAKDSRIGREWKIAAMDGSTDHEWIAEHAWDATPSEHRSQDGGVAIEAVVFAHHRLEMGIEILLGWIEGVGHAGVGGDDGATFVESEPQELRVGEGVADDGGGMFSAGMTVTSCAAHAR
jgi:hypothetical protein